MIRTENILAICYDFDRTLTPDDMQAQGYIQQLNEDVSSFWAEADSMARKNMMDPNLAYMYMMLTGAKGKFEVRRKKLQEFGSKVKLYDGVTTWFDRITEFGKRYQVTIEHYVISSGLKEMIEGSLIFDKFKSVYANSFYYDQSGNAVWPAQLVNFTNKTQFLFRISKGALDVNDDRVNEYFSPDQIRIPFKNMIYIGDSMTDIPCMKLVYSLGGHSIGVFDNQKHDTGKVLKLLKDRRIRYFAPAVYTAGSKLDLLVKNIIVNSSTEFVLDQAFNRDLDQIASEDDRSK